jgi:glycosyltransferase involved in cell wall biosynthesis
VTKILFVTQQLDAEHPTLGAAAGMVRALAELVDELVVIAAAVAAETLPPNVRLRSFDASTQLLRGARYETALVRELGHGRPTALLAHMSPIYALLAAPLLRPLRVPLLLWFTQQQAGARLAQAERVVDAILSVDARSVPLASPKVRAIGHGIDTGAFACAPSQRGEGPLRLLSLGRYTEVKRHDLTLRAVRLLVDDGMDVELTIHGEEARRGDALVRSRLEDQVHRLGLEGRARLLDPVPHSHVPALLAQSDVLVNATDGASADKVVFEALAACVAAVAASPVFDALLPDELRFEDEGGLAGAISAAAAIPSERLHELRRRVETEHSVQHWADAVLACTLARA